MPHRSASRRRTTRGVIALTLATVVASLAGQARGTWSILLTDTRTGETVLATATCLTGFDMLPATPVVVTGLGVATAQSFVENTGQNRTLIRDAFILGTDPVQMLLQLQGFDTGHQTRQYGIADTRGRAATFSGRQNGPFASGRTGQISGQSGGQIGTITYAVQGNVITGQCVIDAAINAIEGTPGTLGDRALAAMEAARLVGGDGRCSCNSDAPDSCGCPPPGSPTIKSAHIGVMIIARAGDTDRATAVYRCGASPGATILTDADGDGRADLITANASGNSVTILRNATPLFSPAPVFVPGGTITGINVPRAVALADVSGDGLADLVVASGGSTNITIVRAVSPGVFTGPRTTHPVASSPQGIAMADVDNSGRPDVLVACPSASGVSVLLNDHAGSLGPQTLVGLGASGSPQAVAIGELDGDGVIHAIVATASRNALGVMTTLGNGTFFREPDFAITGRPQSVLLRDLDDDGRLDIVVAAQVPNRALVLFREEGGTFTSVGVSLPFAPIKVLVADVDGDTLPDLIARGTAQFAIARGSGPRTFAAPVTTTVYASTGDLAVADLDADGLPDLAASIPSFGSAAVFRNARGTFDARAGTANGDHYFLANIANQAAGAPDPVLQLAQRYQDFRVAQIGRPDALASLAEIDRTCALAHDPEALTLTLRPRDLNGTAVALTPARVLVEHAPGSAGASAFEPAQLHADGSLLITVRPGADTGLDRLRITILSDGTAGSRHVTLMPDVFLRVAPTPDFDLDGILTPDDVSGFVACYFSATDTGEPCPAADFNHDGTPDPDDLADFIAAFFGDACG